MSSENTLEDFSLTISDIVLNPRWDGMDIRDSGFNLGIRLREKTKDLQIIVSNSYISPAILSDMTHQCD